MKKIAIVTNPNVEKSKEIGINMSEIFRQQGFENDVLDIDDLKSGYDFVFAVGGDGTMLKTARFYSKFELPVMGVNLGRLGFLSLITPDEIVKLANMLKTGDYNIQPRIMLEVNEKTVIKALNDIVIKGCTYNRTSKFSLYINDAPVYDCIADGIVVSTPTGSTAYGLSAGGPVLSPDLNCIVIVPICAHTMTVRPLVIPDNEKITVKIMGKDEFLTASADGQQTLSNLKEIVIQKSKNPAKLAFPKDEYFYSILKNKLYWGVSAISE